MTVSISRTPASKAQVPAQYLTFGVGHEMFAVCTLGVREIVEYGPITALPMSPPSIRGIISLRGAAIPVLDLGMCLGSGLTQESPRTCIVMLEVAAAGGAGLVGIIVDAVSEVLEIPSEQIEPAPRLQGRLSPTFIVGVGKLHDRFVLLLDIEQMLSTDEWSALLPLVVNEQGLAS